MTCLCVCGAWTRERRHLAADSGTPLTAPVAILISCCSRQRHPLPSRLSTVVQSAIYRELSRLYEQFINRWYNVFCLYDLRAPPTTHGNPSTRDQQKASTNDVVTNVANELASKNSQRSARLDYVPWRNFVVRELNEDDAPRHHHHQQGHSTTRKTFGQPPLSDGLPRHSLVVLANLSPITSFYRAIFGSFPRVALPGS